MIPKIIHKIWFDFGNGKLPPKEYLDYEKGCQNINKEWKIMRWNESNATELIKQKYPQFYKIFSNYPYPIQKVDAIRYFILYTYGGAYMDMDIKCVKKFDTFNDDKIYLTQESNSNTPNKFNNFLMVSPPKHRFWLHVFNALKNNSESMWNIITDSFGKVGRMRFLDILNSAGPGMLTNAYKTYEHKDDIIILPKELFNPCDACGNCTFKNNYIVHMGDAKWTKGHERIIVLIYCYRFYLLTIFIIFIIVLIILAMRKK